MVKRLPFIRSDISNFTSVTMWTAGDYMREISFGHLKITDHTATAFTIRIKICPCAYGARTQMEDVYIFVTTVTSGVSIRLCILTGPLVG
jgi:hypothetical protein